MSEHDLWAFTCTYTHNTGLHVMHVHVWRHLITLTTVTRSWAAPTSSPSNSCSTEADSIIYWYQNTSHIFKMGRFHLIYIHNSHIHNAKLSFSYFFLNFSSKHLTTSTSQPGRYNCSERKPLHHTHTCTNDHVHVDYLIHKLPPTNMYTYTYE